MRSLLFISLLYSSFAKSQVTTVDSAGNIYPVREINIKQLGAKGDGVFDNTTIFKQARDLSQSTTLPIHVPAGTYFVSDSTIFNKTTIFGDGLSSVIKVTSTTLTGIYLQDSCEVFGMKFIGSGKGTIPAGVYTTQNGIRVHGGYNNIHDCYFTMINGSGIILYQTSAAQQMKNRVSNCNFTNCTIGIFPAISVEYGLYTGNNMDYCVAGIWERSSGNNKYVNCSMTFCTDGFRLTGGGNGDHGAAVGCTFNHCTNGINIEFTSSSFIFTGCNIWYNNVLFGSAGQVRNVTISESVFSGTPQTITATSTFKNTCSIRDNLFVGTFTKAGADTLEYVNNKNTSDPTYARMDSTGRVSANTINIVSFTPSSSNDPTGNVGDETWDNNFRYIKTPEGWKRVPLATF